MATAKRPRRSNRKKIGTINVTASSTISQLPPVPPTLPSNSAPLYRRQIMPPAPAPLWMQPSIPPPNASTVLPSSSLRPFQTLLPFPSPLVPSSQQLAAPTAAALSSSRPLSTSARVALPSTLSSVSTAPPPAQRRKQHHAHDNRRSHSINATPTMLHPPLLPAVSSSAIAAASTAPSLAPWIQRRKRSNEFIEQDDSANNECGATANQKELPPTLRSKYLPPVQFDSEVETVEDKIRRKVENMMNLEERKKNYPEDSERLDRLRDLFLRFALLFYKKFVSEHGLEKRPLPKDVDDNGGDYVWERDGRLTIGQTTNFASRGKERLGGDGKITKREIEQHMSMLYTTAESIEVAESADLCVIFEEISAMYHPRLACYANAGKEEKRRERIARGLIEGAIGASTGVYIDKAYEDFLEKPSDEILRIISSPEVDPEYAECVGSIKCWLPFFTWEHFVSYLRRCAKKKEELSSDQIDFLRQVIIDLDCEFLQKHIYDRTMGGDGVNIMKWVDAVPGEENPRVIELMNVVEELKRVLPESVMKSFKEDATTIPQDVAESVKGIVNGISKDDYVSPSADVLAEGYASGLRKLKQLYRGRDDLAITFEFAKYDVICKDEDLKNELFGDCETLKQNDIDGNTAEIFFRSDVGPSFRVIHSSHVGLGENQTDVQRVNSVQRTMTTMTVNNQAGILPDEAFEDERRTYCAFFMNWFGFGGSLNGRDGSFYLARSAAVGDGICNRHVVRAGALMTGNVIGRGISGPATTFLRCNLEQDRFNAVLTICRGEITNEDNPSPIDDPDQREVWAKKRQQQHYQEHKEEIKEYNRQYYQEHKEEIQEYNRQYYQEHKEEIQEYNRQYYQEHKEEIQEYNRQYYQENKEEMQEYKRQYMRKYRQEHKEEMQEYSREYSRQYYEEHKEQKREYNRQYYEEHKEEIKEKDRERRAQKSQQRMDDRALEILQKAEAAYKLYLECKRKDRVDLLSRPNLYALLKYIAEVDPTVKYIKEQW